MEHSARVAVSAALTNAGASTIETGAIASRRDDGPARAGAAPRSAPHAHSARDSLADIDATVHTDRDGVPALHPSDEVIVGASTAQVRVRGAGSSASVRTRLGALPGTAPCPRSSLTLLRAGREPRLPILCPATGDSGRLPDWIPAYISGGEQRVLSASLPAAASSQPSPEVSTSAVCRPGVCRTT
jgi:hypothetical protein